MSANHPKCRDLEIAGIPVFQIAVKAGGFFYIDEEELVDLDIEEAGERISRHCRKIANTFKKQIVGVLFNNPESPALRHGRDLYDRLVAAETQIRALETENSEAYEHINALLADNSCLHVANAEYLNRLNAVQNTRSSENQARTYSQDIQMASMQSETADDKRLFWKRWFK
ncbi:hypothetical protein [Neisseria animalis]|uniref:Uncharacterized protein n=1 Tax=Neisseria animalis TaxID=492 RepID=A0A5P3MTA3_NEIAN|nr:hypothetical protein [Neisseria animalis]QEY24852.1 hypothetical protein D0T90_10520 [Neisseria animalis]ROW31549.1 hypothetical protein CGZ60_09565 [Neisseria animalis]VEE08003.1 Uncharacterised protein [Neisseria animalis]